MFDLSKIALLVAFFSQNVLAGTIFGGNSEVAMYYPVTGAVYLKFDGTTMLNPAGCTDNYYYVVPESHAQYEEYKKILLSSLILGKKIGVYLWDNKCSGPYPEVYSLWINK